MLRRNLLIMVVVLAVMAGNVPAATTTFTAATGDWSNSSNWDIGEPTASDTAIVDVNNTASITQNNEACSTLYVGTTIGGTGYISMSDGTLDADSIKIGYLGCDGTFIQSGGTVATPQMILDRLSAGNPPSNAYYRLDGGTLDVDSFYLGYLDEQTGTAILDVNEPNLTLTFHTLFAMSEIAEYYAEPNTTIYLDSCNFGTIYPVSAEHMTGLQNTRLVYDSTNGATTSQLASLSDDLGSVIEGFTSDNMMIKQIDIGGPGFIGGIRVVDLQLHGDPNITDAVYVETLNITAGSTIDMDVYDVNVYYKYSTIDPNAIIVGSEHLINVPILLASFSDAYERMPSDTLYDKFADLDKWPTIVGTPVVDTTGVDEPSATTSLHLESTDEVQSLELDLSNVTAVTVTYYWERYGLESGDTLYVEYWDSSAWQQLNVHLYNEGSTTAYTEEKVNLPAGALHSRFRLRFRSACDSDADEWYIDNVLIAPVNTSEVVTNYELTTLWEEYQGVGITLGNDRDSDLTCSITVDGLEDGNDFYYEIRRQVFANSWYYPNKLMADAMTLLSSSNNEWSITIPAKEKVGLCLGIYTYEDASEPNTVTITIETPDGYEQLFLDLNVVEGVSPTSISFNNSGFVYPWLNVALNFPYLAAEDLANHKATSMQFPSIPVAEFEPNGTLISVNYDTLDARLAAYGPEVDRLILFWEGQYNSFPCEDCTDPVGYLEPYTTAWDTAYCNLLDAWLDHADACGFDSSHFAVMALDEVHSASFAVSPDEEMDKVSHMYNLIKSVDSNIPVAFTVSDYAGPNDVEVLTDYADILMPTWTYRITTLTGQPTGYNPKEGFYDTILPMLLTWSEGGGELWSYHVCGGKNDDVLLSNRAYPILAFGDGLMGVGIVNYNVARGSTWDARDGGGLDYILVYDGNESHADNLTYNVDEEMVVPSIRWQALRAGVQDARILRYLENIQPNCTTSSQTNIQSILDYVENMTEDVASYDWLKPWLEFTDYNGIVTPNSVHTLAEEMRILLPALEVVATYNDSAYIHDNTLVSGVGTNYGTSTTLILGSANTTPIRRIIIRFDGLSSLAGKYSSINSATLKLRQKNSSASTSDFYYSIYAITDENASWLETDTNWLKRSMANTIYWPEADSAVLAMIMKQLHRQPNFMM